MHARIPLAAILLALLSACSGLSAVTPSGENTFHVSYNAGMKPLSWVEIKAQALQQAAQYCESIGRTLYKPQITSNHATGLAPKKASVTFECNAPPTASRPNHQPK